MQIALDGDKGFILFLGALLFDKNNVIKTSMVKIAREIKMMENLKTILLDFSSKGKFFINVLM